MTLRGANDSTKRNEAARKKLEAERDAAREYTDRIAAQRWPPRVLKAVTQVKLSRHYGQGL